ncbi:MAG: hypothetical protein V3T70_03260 [Phycisphaerae bacterium]
MIVDEDGVTEVIGGDDSCNGRRGWIGIHFTCCGAYSRIYRNNDRTAYVGKCPRCLRNLRLTIGPGGTDQRQFRAH